MSWQKKLAMGFNSAQTLLRFLELPPGTGDHAEKQFATRVPLSFAQRMKKGDPHDPLLLQVLAHQEELQVVHGYSTDPLSEKSANPIEGLIHKYHGRVLLTLTGACAVNCRYCFRRHFPYHHNNPGRVGWQKVYQYIEKDLSINEVILSGGDPLLSSNLVLADLIKNLERIAHVKTLRIHTRIPVVFPERLDKELRYLLHQCPLQKVVVLHSNHPQELNTEVERACQELKDAGCTLLNQSVFLKGINDKAEILAQLSHKLFAYSVLPYYLHILDKVQGAAHFAVSLAHIRLVYEQLQNSLPGYLVPRLAQEIGGRGSKTLII